ncbi:MAG TPA: class I SAM-dependent methyltransferase [Gemmatimonadaceae bacterium]
MTSVQTTAFDPHFYKQTTERQWQAAAGAWNEWTPVLRSWLGPATELMLDMAGVGMGSRVLDVAAGAGDQTLQAAKRVGSTGFLLATDIATRILEYAAANAQAAGFENVKTLVADGEDLHVPEGSFDAVISRVGLIYFPDQQKALAGMKRALRPGGRIGAIVYSTAEGNRFFSLPVSIIRRRAQLGQPAPGQPGPFSLGSPGAMEAAYRRAGFRDIEVKLVAAPLRMASAAECVRFEKESFGALHQMLSGLDEIGREAAWAEIAEEMRQFERDGGFEGPCELVVASAVN